MVRRKWIVPFKEGQRFPEIRRALQENRPVSREAVDRLIKQNKGNMARIRQENIYKAAEKAGFKRQEAWEFIRGNAVRNVIRMQLNPQRMADAEQEINDAMHESGGRIEVFVEKCEGISNRYGNEALRERQRLKRL